MMRTGVRQDEVTVVRVIFLKRAVKSWAIIPQVTNATNTCCIVSLMKQRTNSDTAVLPDQGLPDTSSPVDDAKVGTTTRRTWVAYALLSVFVFATTWMGALGWMNRALIADLFYESSLARFRVASGEAGPATFYVFHNDFTTLERLAQENEDILGVELSEYSGIAAMAFTSLETDAVNQIRNHSVVRNMIQKDIPMLCH